MNENEIQIKIRNIFIAVSIIAIGLVFSLDSIVYINPGYVGVFINKLSGSIKQEPIHAGYEFKLPFVHDIIEYPYYMQTIILSKYTLDGYQIGDDINVNSVEGQPLSCDVSMSFTLEPSKVPAIYTSFRQEIEQITHGFIKQTVRQVMQEVVGKINVADFLGKDKGKAVNQIEELLSSKLLQYGFTIKQFTLNEIRAPESVINAISQKNIMEQEALMAENKLLKVKYEAMQKIEQARGKSESILIYAQAQAQANKILNSSINDNLVKYKEIEKWDGNLPKYNINSKTQAFINIDMKEEKEQK
jgi:regulator of protease activity HflC (stomatin/prohibitin superfamily)